MDDAALGMIETVGLVPAVAASDAGLKAADVRLLELDYTRGGLVMVRFEGDVAAVRAAVDAGAFAARRIGHVFGAHVIARAMPEVFRMLASNLFAEPAGNNQGGCVACGGCEGGRREIAGRVRKAVAIREKLARERRSSGGTITSAQTVPASASPRALSPQRAFAGNAGEAPPSPADLAATPPSARIALPEDLRSRTVAVIRQFVRKLPDFPLQPGEIRTATRAKLLEALDRYERRETPQKG